MNKSKLISMILTIFLLVFYTSTVFADGVAVPEEVRTTLVNITKILLLVGTAVCIGKIIHIGILYVTSTAVDKSNAKQALLPWILGTIICFGAATIGGAIIKIFEDAGAGGDVLGI